MANPYKGEVEFQVDGKTYMVKFSSNVMAEIDETLDPADANRIMTAGRASARVMRKVFWLALRANHPEIKSEQEAGELVGFSQLLEVTQRGLMLAVLGPDKLAGLEAAEADQRAPDSASTQNPLQPDQKGVIGPAPGEPGSN